ncbi:MAG: periplasmic heavy metal sensor [Acidobacteria bacterium]|nr:periplasmic heavy metal sensor [Acidobacteriota bacterium]
MNGFAKAVSVLAVAGVIAGGSAGLAAQAGAQAQEQGRNGPRGGRGPGGIGGGEMGLMLRGLDLTDSQGQQVRDLADRYRDQNADLLQRLAQAASAHRTAASALPADETAIRTTLQELATVQAEVAVQRARLRNDVFAQLTPEQQARVKARIDDRQQDRRRGPGARAPRSGQGRGQR